MGPCMGASLFSTNFLPFLDGRLGLRFGFAANVALQLIPIYGF